MCYKCCDQVCQDLVNYIVPLPAFWTANLGGLPHICASARRRTTEQVSGLVRRVVCRVVCRVGGRSVKGASPVAHVARHVPCLCGMGTCICVRGRGGGDIVTVPLLLRLLLLLLDVMIQRPTPICDVCVCVSVVCQQQRTSHSGASGASSPFSPFLSLPHHSIPNHEPLCAPVQVPPRVH